MAAAHVDYSPLVFRPYQGNYMVSGRSDHITTVEDTLRAMGGTKLSAMRWEIPAQVLVLDENGNERLVPTDEAIISIFPGITVLTEEKFTMPFTQSTRLSPTIKAEQPLVSGLIRETVGTRNQTPLPANVGDQDQTTYQTISYRVPVLRIGDEVKVQGIRGTYTVTAVGGSQQGIVDRATLTKLRGPDRISLDAVVAAGQWRALLENLPVVIRL